MGIVISGAGQSDRAAVEPCPGLRRFNRPCPVCASYAPDLIHEARYALFDDSELPVETALVQCADCGMAYVDSCATSSAYRTHYARHSKYDSVESASGSGLTSADATRLARQVERVAAFIGPGSAVLDVGAGQGGLIAAFVERGFADVTGMDPAPGCVAAIRRRGFVAEVGVLEDVHWRVDPRRFGLVTLSHVLEHVFDAHVVLERVASRVAAGGRIYVEVPDAARYTMEGFPPFYFLDPEHINHFEVAALDRLAARCGWRIERAWQEWIALDGAVRYPIVAALLVRDRAEASTPRVVSHPIVDYVATCRAAAIASQSGALVAAWVAARRPIVLWGAGSHAQRLLAQSPLARCAIDCIVDGDIGKQGRRLAGLPVVDEATGLARATGLDADVVVAIAVGADKVIARLAADQPALRTHIL